MPLPDIAKNNPGRLNLSSGSLWVTFPGSLASADILSGWLGFYLPGEYSQSAKIQADSYRKGLPIINQLPGLKVSPTSRSCLSEGATWYSFLRISRY